MHSLHFHTEMSKAGGDPAQRKKIIISILGSKLFRIPTHRAELTHQMETQSAYRYRIHTHMQIQ